MTPFLALLRELADGGFQLFAIGNGSLAVEPASRLTEAQVASIRQFKDELLELLRFHGPNLLGLFHDPPGWPRLRGRFGLLADPDAVLQAVGRPVSLRNGRDGTLRAVLYETRTGWTRCRVDLAGGESLALDPEDLLPATIAEGRSA